MSTALFCSQEIAVAQKDRPPMTMQVGMVGSDGIILASDTKIWAQPPGLGRTITAGLSKIKISESAKIAVLSAGDMSASSRVADAIIANPHLAGSSSPEARICEIAMEELAKWRF